MMAAFDKVPDVRYANDGAEWARLALFSRVFCECVGTKRETSQNVIGK